MGLFTTPLALNDGVVARTFNFKGQLTDQKGGLAGEYYEPAAASAVDSKITIRHTSSKNQKRHLLQRVENESVTTVTCGTSCSSYEPVIVNITISHGYSNTDAFIEKQVKLAIDAAMEANFTSGMTHGLI